MGGHLRLIYYVILAELMCLLLGYHLSVMSGAMLLLVDTFHLDIVWQQVIVTASVIGGAVSLLPAGYLVHIFGRKKIILGGNLLICAGSVITAASYGKEVLLVGRFVTGLGIGIPTLVVPMYVSECAPANIRGRLGSLTQLMINGGILLSAVMGGAFIPVQYGWRYLLAMPCVVGVIQFLGFLFAPETPRWLIDKGRMDEAREVLKVLIEDTDNVQSEMDDIQRALTEEKKTAQGQKSFVMVRALKSSPVRRALILAVFLAIIFQATGIPVVLAYSGTIIKMAGFASGNAAWLATVPFAIQLMATCITTCVVDKLGRKILFVGAHIGIVTALIVLGLGFYLSSRDSPAVNTTIVEAYSNGTNITDCPFRTCHDCIYSLNNRCGLCYDVIEDATCIPVYENGSAVGGRCLGNMFNQSDFKVETDVCPSGYSWIPVLGLSLYVLAFGSGAGVIWIVISEVFPLWARSACSSVATITIWLTQTVASVTFLSVVEAITIHGIFWLYAGCAVLAVIYTCIFLPETRGKRLEDIEKLFMLPEEQRALSTDGSKQQYSRY